MAEFDPADVPGDDAPVVDWNGHLDLNEKEYRRRLNLLVLINLLGWAGLIVYLLWR